MEHLDDNTASEFVSGGMAASIVTKVETHLAGCRDCRALVAALAGGDEHDSNARTHRHEKLSESQVTKRPTRTLAIGDRVGRYLVLSTLGTGGMGVVFSAYDPQLDRKVALKLLRGNLGANTKDARVRLKREAQAIAQLSHPNVVGVYDVGSTDDGDVYIAMEFVEGDTLTAWLRRWPRTWREILEVFDQAARGLGAAHSVGLLHRDFKPDNVLVGGDGRVRVTDFGLARSVLGPEEAVRQSGGTPTTPLHVDLTATGTVLGTPRYMPPEQLLGPDIDARSDQFSFCVALYEALFGQHPLTAATSVGMLERSEKALPPPENTRVPAAIGRAVLRGLERDRGKRFPTMALLMHELRPAAPRSSVRAVAFAALVLVLAGGATAAVVTRPKQRPPEMPIDDNAVSVLISEINHRDTEIKQLRQSLLELRDSDRGKITTLEQQLEQKETEVNQLVDQVTRLHLQASKVAGQPKQLVLPQDDHVVAAIQGAQHDVAGCLEEWSERAAVDRPTASHDAQLVVRFGVTPAGVGYDAKTVGTDSPSLGMCVADALARINYPRGPEALELEVQVNWRSGDLAMTGRVVGHREASPGSTLDGL